MSLAHKIAYLIPAGLQGGYVTRVVAQGCLGDR